MSCCKANLQHGIIVDASKASRLYDNNMESLAAGPIPDKIVKVFDKAHRNGHLPGLCERFLGFFILQ